MVLPPRTPWRVARETKAPELPDPETFLEPGVDALPVRIVIQQDVFVTGWDDGALGFEDDAVWFSGQASSFRIYAADVVAPMLDRRDAPRMTTTRLLDMGLPLNHPERAIYVRIAVLPAEGRKDWQDQERVAMEIRRLWLLDESHGTSQYPPLALRPGAKLWEAGNHLSTTQLAGLSNFRDSFGTLFTRGLFPDVGHRMTKARLLRALAEEGY